MKNCKFCGKPLDSKPNAHNHKFCDVTCRNKELWQRVKVERTEAARAKSGAFAQGKKQCKECGYWYMKPMAHAWQRHKLSAKAYKELHDLPLSLGIIPEDHRELLRHNALVNGMDDQLKRVGISTRYKKGDPKAIAVTGWKGRTGNKGYQENIQ